MIVFSLYKILVLQSSADKSEYLYSDILLTCPNEGGEKKKLIMYDIQKQYLKHLSSKSLSENLFSFLLTTFFTLICQELYKKIYSYTVL